MDAQASNITEPEHHHTVCNALLLCLTVQRDNSPTHTRQKNAFPSSKPPSFNNGVSECPQNRADFINCLASTNTYLESSVPRFPFLAWLKKERTMSTPPPQPRLKRVLYPKLLVRGEREHPASLSTV